VSLATKQGGNLQPNRRRQRWLWNVGVPAFLLVVALLPRVVAFSPLNGPDELTWLERSVAFYDALQRGDWAATLQSRHPGVVPMWGFGALLCARYGLTQLRAWQVDGTWPMVDMAGVALFFPVLISVATVLAAYGLVRRLANREAALYAALLLALEPYYLSFTHDIHLDAIQASLMLVAALLWLNYLRPPRRWPYLLGAGVVAGLALLTRTQSLYLVPFSLLALGGYFLAETWTGKDFRLRPQWRRWLGYAALSWLVWLGILALTVFALWPALWASPLAIVKDLVGGAVEGVTAAHPGQVFFLGQVINHDPGVLYYLLILLFRLRPLTLALVVLNPALLALVWRRLSRQERAAWGLGWGYVLFYSLAMTLASDKLERYLLPLFPALALLAGVSLAVITHLVAGWIARWRARPVPPGLRLGVPVAVVVLLAIPWLRLAPYYSAYFSPLFGGGPRAAQLFTVGSGGAPGLTASYLDAKPDAQDLWVLSFYPTVFGYHFKGHTQAPSWGSLSGLPVAAQYVVVTLGQVQRDIYPSTLDFFLPRQPEYTIRINDLDYAWIYRVPRQELSVAPPIQHPTDWNFEHRVHLAGYDVAQAGDELHLTLYWQLIVSIPQQVKVTLRLVDSAGRLVAELTEPPWSGDAAVLSWPGGLLVRDQHVLALPADLPAGDYELRVSLTEWDDQGQARALKLEGEAGTEAVLGPVPLVAP
jgi:hypothetical protein